MKTRLWLQEDCRLAALRGFQGLARGEAEAEEAEAEQPAIGKKTFPNSKLVLLHDQTIHWVQKNVTIIVHLTL